MDTLSPSPLAEEYRAMLDAERAMKLSRGTNHEGEGKKDKKEKKEKKSKKSEAAGGQHRRQSSHVAVDLSSQCVRYCSKSCGAARRKSQKAFQTSVKMVVKNAEPGDFVKFFTNRACDPFSCG